MTIDEFWKRLSGYGVAVPPDIQRRVGLDMCQERIMIRPTAPLKKSSVLGYGTGVPATFVARELGVTVQYVRKIRRLLRPG
jgi:hypothetical protein